jgi:hypothetical protein
VFAGLSSYPLALVGALASACWKLRLVLGQFVQGSDRVHLILPVLLWRSLRGSARGGALR